MLTKREDSQSRKIAEGPLKDKVALLYDGANMGGQSLAVSLAKQGADIAIVYRQAHAGQAHELKNLVEAEGKRCLIIPAQTNDETLSCEVVRRTIDTLGQLDIFIDYSSQSGDGIAPANNADVVEKRNLSVRTAPFINVEVLSAALDQMVGLDRKDMSKEGKRI